ncbi:uncharacterized protein LY89DRAFT_669233 [Mollisia scopiformis]|uniref:Uncharacterized protein n=1 Tax=Mollisia scopiformis TaxID=149040 RepID=A0A194X9H2_MOLSC|nr:uncharacterized protein LY89DRAFT_669233 [Mollisia scopiformis]KUJ16774.1 hypothetical protein LY89DRAFT_669233 [Mollisia scopiformis]
MSQDKMPVMHINTLRGGEAQVVQHVDAEEQDIKYQRYYTLMKAIVAADEEWEDDYISRHQLRKIVWEIYPGDKEFEKWLLLRVTHFPRHYPNWRTQFVESTIRMHFSRNAFEHETRSFQAANSMNSLGPAPQNYMVATLSNETVRGSAFPGQSIDSTSGIQKCLSFTYPGQSTAPTSST